MKVVGVDLTDEVREGMVCIFLSILISIADHVVIIPIPSAFVTDSINVMQAHTMHVSSSPLSPSSSLHLPHPPFPPQPPQHPFAQQRPPIPKPNLTPSRERSCQTPNPPSLLLLESRKTTSFRHFSVDTYLIFLY